MSRKNIIHAITSRPWLIDERFAIASAGIVQKILSGEPVPHLWDQEEGEEELQTGCFAVSPDGQVSFGDYRDPFSGAAPGSTAVIGINGPIMKYDNCGDPGTKTYAARLAQARKNSNISSVVLSIDSPGGTVDGTQELADLVNNYSKPIVAFADGLMASAAYWIGSQAGGGIIAQNETTEVGSIGTMLSFIDMQGVWEQKGAEVHYIYADGSPDKNKTFHDAQDGKYAGVKKELNYINDQFHSGVKNARPDVKATALTGKIFFAKDAISQGLIDSIGSIDDAISRAQELAGTKPEETTTTTKTNDMKKITLTAAHAALLAICGATITEGKTSVDVDLTDDLVNKMNQVQTDLATKLAAANTALAQANEQLAAKKDELTAAAAALASEKEAHEVLKKSNPGATGSKKEKTGDVLDESTANAEVWNLPHNKSALNNPMFRK